MKIYTLLKEIVKAINLLKAVETDMRSYVVFPFGLKIHWGSTGLIKSGELVPTPLPVTFTENHAVFMTNIFVYVNTLTWYGAVTNDNRLRVYCNDFSGGGHASNGKAAAWYLVIGF